jgi:di/tricarboxylate transporter
MTVHEVVAIATLVAAVALFITEAIPLAMTALAIPVVLAATGTLRSPDEALVGFGNPAVIALAAIFVLGAGLKESGVATLMARGLQRIGGHSEARLVVAIMVAVAVLSAFMPNAATVAVFLPAVAVLARRADVPTSRLMMPLASAAIVGGTLTAIGTTPNLILAEDMRQRVGTALDMFVFAKVGVPVTVLCILFMATIGRRLLPARSSAQRLGRAHLPDELAEAYRFSENLYRMRVAEGSDIAGRTLEEADIDGRWGLKVVLVRRPRGARRRTIHPRSNLRIEPEDELYVEGPAAQAWQLSEEAHVQFGMADAAATSRLLEQGLVLAEATLPPRSEAIGQSFRDLEFRKAFGLSALALWRRGDVKTVGLADEPLELGDAFLVSGTARAVQALTRDQRFIVLTQDTEGEDVRRAPVAIGLLLAALLPPILGWLPLAVSALGSALLMIATKCVSMSAVRQSIDYRILFLIAGTIPLGMALEQHGVAGDTAAFILNLQAPLGSAGVFSALFVVSAVLSTTSNNGAAAVILAPVAWQVSAASGLPLEKTFMAVAFGTSCAFMLPFAQGCNLMVMGPGGYHTRDFARVGLGLSLVMAAGTIVVLELL